MLEEGNIIHGFEIGRIRELPDCKGELYEMVHLQTGAELCWLKRDEDNKTFSITFKTLPSDDTGVFHILEHSVLNGSKKYPVREPFVNLLKSSLQTFLNAMTYPDKTVYPVSSRNEKDFMNLMSVYLDAVFNPLLHENPNIFRQEGWHYEIRSEEDEVVYNGVVLNEMKGAFSSVDETIITELNRQLFRDNCYQYVSGGDPKSITDLTYEQFKETHKKFYHPSNARVFLDGDLPIEKVLAFINDEYFSKYEREEMDFSIPLQEEKEATNTVYNYEVAPDEDLENKTMISFARILSNFDNVEKNTAWSALASVLIGNNESPLKKAIIDAALGQDVELDLYDGIQQPWAVLIIRNTNEEQFDQVRDAITKTAERLVENGLDHEELLSTINHMEFKYKERHEPSGLIFAERALNAWLYEGDPATYLDCADIFDTLRERVEQGYFEDLLKEFLLDEEHLTSVVAVPSNTLQAERLQQEKAKLQVARDSWDDVNKYIEENKVLDAWQATEDTPEQIATLPTLELSDVEEEPSDFPFDEKIINGIPVISYAEEDSGIVYMNMYFSLAGITVDKLPEVSFFTGLLSNLPTKDKTVLELQSEIKKYVGQLSFSADVMSYENDPERAKPLLSVSLAALNQNKEKAVALALEILQKTVFDKDSILPLLKQELETFRQAMIMAGHSFAMRRVAAHNSAEGVFKEYVSGYEAFKWIKDLDDHYEDKIDAFIEEARLYQELLFTTARLTISQTGDQSELTKQFVEALPAGQAERNSTVHYPLLKTQKEAIEIPAGVSYSAWGANLNNYGLDFNNAIRVMGHILTFDYLWNEVRVKGGAYGTGFAINTNHSVGAYSYRDPSPITSMETYGKIPDYLKEFVEKGEQLDQYIIGAIAAQDPLLSPSARIRIADSLYLRNISYEDRCTNRTELLQAKPNDFNKYIDVFERVKNEGARCIVGAKDTIAACQKDGYTILYLDETTQSDE